EFRQDSCRARARARGGSAMTEEGVDSRPFFSERMEMAKTATNRSLSMDLDPIDRLEEKIKQLVNMVDRMKTEQARTAEENQRLTHELDSVQGRLRASDGLTTEVTTLKEERDVIRTRVTDMLEQL